MDSSSDRLLGIYKGMRACVLDSLRIALLHFGYGCSCSLAKSTLTTYRKTIE
jgi:hypothetical protein